MTRSNAREIAAHLIFQMNFTKDPSEQVIEAAMEPLYYDSLAQETEIYADRPEPKQMDYIRQVVLGACEKQEELDCYIRQYAINWSVSRISKVARAIMHVAMYECLYVHDVPVSSAINEAVELTRKYEDEDVVSFVNGILGSFARALEAGELEAVLAAAREQAAAEEAARIQAAEEAAAAAAEAEEAAPAEVLPEEQA